MGRIGSKHVKNGRKAEGIVEKRGPAERRGGNKKGPRGLIARSAAAIVQEPRPGATGSAR